MRLNMRLREALEKLVVSGADEEHDDAEMLSLLENVDFENLARIFRFVENPIYEYWAGGFGMYFGRRLTDYNAIRIYEDLRQEDFDEENSFRRSLELWLLSDMSLLVTSCYRADCDPLFSEYRCAKSVDWKEAGMDLDFVELADFLEYLSEYADENNLPYYEE